MCDTQSGESFLCALTALEVARRIGAGNDRKAADISAKIAVCIREFAHHQSPPRERLQIECSDQVRLKASFLETGSDAPDGRDFCVIEHW